MEKHQSESEENGIKAIPVDSLLIYSVGVSTAGEAEVRMAVANPDRKIIATTIDVDGADFANKYINERGLSNRVAVKIEDVTAKLHYPNNSFDFEYARLVLHYLAKNGLAAALANLYRILKPGGKIFIVVRSAKSENFTAKTSTYDGTTGLTAYHSISDPSKIKRRYFHTPESISEYLNATGFHIEYIKEYNEVIYTDFKREGRPSNEPLIELVAIK